MSSNLSSSFHQFNFEVAKASAHSIYVFDGFRLDWDRLMLYRGELPTALPPKAVETLGVLVRNRGEIVGKEELIEAVWKGSIVEESNLTQYLYLIRKTLGTRAGGRPYIETLRKRGYRFDSDTLECELSPALIEQPEAEPPKISHPTGKVIAFAARPQVPHRGDERPSTSISSSRTLALLATVQAVLLVIVVGAVVWFNSGAAGVGEEEEGQISVLRLTDGMEVNDAVISPDGKYFTYTEIDGGRSRMWVQQTGQTNRREVVPWVDKGLGVKTFSPDSQFIYYVEGDASVNNSLYKVPAFGGPPVKILSGINSSVSFSRNGNEFIYYRYLYPEKTSQIVKRETGGTGAESVVYSWKDEAPGSNVAWSPDGGTIAFTSRSFRDLGGNCSFYGFRLDDPEPKPLTQDSWESCYQLVWRPDGKGFYTIATKDGDGYTTKRDQLYFISFPAGRSRRVSTEGSRHQVASVSVTDENSVLVVPYNRVSQIWVMDPNGDTRTAVQITKGLADGRAGIAPMADGRVAYIARTGENLSIWTMNADGSDQKQLTTEPQFMEELRAGGGGRYLFFSVPKGRHNDLYRIDADGSGLRQVTHGPRVIDSGASHDGKWVAYSGSVPSGVSYELGLWKMPTEGGEPVRFPVRGCDMPHFSPDDEMISCVEDQARVKILSSADGTVLKTFELPPRSTVNFGARWSPDGKAVVYIVGEKDVTNLWLHPVDGSPLRRLTDFPTGSIYHFAYSLDGKRLFIARGTQIRDAVLISDPGR